MMRFRGVILAGAVAAFCSLAVAPPAFAQTTPPIPVPRPFPQPNQPSTTTAPPSTSKPSTPDTPPPAARPETPPATAQAPVATATPSAAVARPSDQQLGVAVYPAAEYIDSYDAGPGERIYLFGTNATYAEIVAYFRNTLKDGGREIFKAPAMQEFDLGRSRDDNLSFPPSVTVKDYTWSPDGQRSEGYLAVDGTKEKRFKTIIQIVALSGR